MTSLRRFISLTILFAAAFLFTGNACAGEVIKNFDVTAFISTDASITVVETIEIDVDNTDIHQGIVRLFPIEYRDSSDVINIVPFEVRKVQLDGAAVHYKVTESGGSAQIKIGRSDKTIGPGLHTFTIVYDTGDLVGFFKDHDELYWNVTGNGWKWPIESASFSVALPGKKPGEGFAPSQVEWYTGPLGSKDGHMKGARFHKSGTVLTTAPLAPGSGLTAVYTWPKGIIAEPDPKAGHGALTVIGAVTFMLTLCFCFFVWRRWGKEPLKKTVIPLFRPPCGASPASLRYALELKLDSTGFASDILDLVVKKAFTISDKASSGGAGNAIKLQETGGGAGLTSDEEIMLDLLPETISFGKKAGLKNELCEAYYALEDFEAEGGAWPEEDELQENMKYKLLPAIFIIAAGIAAMFFFDKNAAYFNLLMGGTLAAGAVIWSLVFINRCGRRQTKASVFKCAVPAIVCAVPAVGCSFIEASICLPAQLLLIASAGVFSMFSAIMERRTKFGMDLMTEIEGFKMYLGTAEKDRIAAMSPPEKDTPELFERYLPYALALGAAKTWGDRFRDMIEAGLVSAAAISFYNGGLRNAVSEISRQSYARNSAARPGSSTGASGSGGGGFSGGGGGGGGGAGW